MQPPVSTDATPRHRVLAPFTQQRGPLALVARRTQCAGGGVAWGVRTPTHPRARVAPLTYGETGAKRRRCFFFLRSFYPCASGKLVDTRPAGVAGQTVGRPWPRCLQGRRGQWASGGRLSHQGLIAPASPTHYTNTILASRTSLRPSAYPPRCFPQVRIFQLPKRHTCQRRDAAAGALTDGRTAGRTGLGRARALPVSPSPTPSGGAATRKESETAGRLSRTRGRGGGPAERVEALVPGPPPPFPPFLLSTARSLVLPQSRRALGWVWEIGKQWRGVVG